MKFQSSQDRNLVANTKIQSVEMGSHRLSRRASIEGAGFAPVCAVAPPEDRKALSEELKGSELIGVTRDNNAIYLFDSTPDSVLMREIGRLRELAFRMVGEGTGQSRDLDEYDQHYRHLVLWDRENQEIAGSYRLGIGSQIIETFGVQGFYTHSLNQFEPAFHPYLSQALELGRSFVNPAYWCRASLDYLWQGLGSFLAQHPGIRYLFGPVSMSASYPAELRDTVVYYYGRYYSTEEVLATAHHPYRLSRATRQRLDRSFADLDAEAGFDCMQERFQLLGHKLPVLFKQYVSLFQQGGFKALVFSIDQDFGECLDALCLTDLAYLKESKRKRYIGH